MTQGGPAPGRELRKIFVEVVRDRAEDRLVAGFLLVAQPGDELLEVAACSRDVVEPGAQRLESLLELSAFGFGQGVGGTDLLQAPLEGAHLFLACLAAWNLLGRNSIRHAQSDFLHA